MCEIPEPRTPGMYPIEPLPPGWENVWVTIRNTRRVEMLEVASSTLYPQEPLNLIALKCLGLFLVVTPLYYLS
ncbi:MAG: hypothetical protein KGQ49_06530, partial [Verrucomicrobia bacterium]|nr:hypothetical protein [Verrucomicrobiota bacterium]